MSKGFHPNSSKCTLARSLVATRLIISRTAWKDMSMLFTGTSRSFNVKSAVSSSLRKFILRSTIIYTQASSLTPVTSQDAHRGSAKRAACPSIRLKLTGLYWEGQREYLEIQPVTETKQVKDRGEPEEYLSIIKSLKSAKLLSKIKIRTFTWYNHR